MVIWFMYLYISNFKISTFLIAQKQDKLVAPGASPTAVTIPLNASFWW